MLCQSQYQDNKKATTDWDKLFVNTYPMKDLYVGYILNSQNSTIWKQTAQFF